MKKLLVLLTLVSSLAFGETNKIGTMTRGKGTRVFYDLDLATKAIDPTKTILRDEMLNKSYPLHSGSKVEILGERDGFYKVKIADANLDRYKNGFNPIGKFGWIKKDLIKFENTGIMTRPKGTRAFYDYDLAVKSNDPSKELTYDEMHNKSFPIMANSKVEIDEKKGNYYRVIVTDVDLKNYKKQGKTIGYGGWIHKDLIKLDNAKIKSKK